MEVRKNLTLATPCQGNEPDPADLSCSGPTTKPANLKAVALFPVEANADFVISANPSHAQEL